MMVAQEQCLTVPGQCDVAHSGVKYVFTVHGRSHTVKGIVSGGSVWGYCDPFPLGFICCTIVFFQATNFRM